MRFISGLVLSVIVGILGGTLVRAQSPLITYQGHLSSNGVPFSGSAEVRFTLWDAATNGTQVATGTPGTNTVAVKDGTFTAVVNFGSAPWTGVDRWMQLEVRTTNGPFTTLQPRQRVTAAPYALRAAEFSGKLSSAQLIGTFDQEVALTSPANLIHGSFHGNAAGLSNLNATQLTGTVPAAALDQAWKIGGNAGTSNAHFIGTTDNVPLQLRVNGLSGLRLEPRSNWVNVTLGQGNAIDPRVIGSSILGGGSVPNTFFPNTIASDFASIGGGSANTIYTNSPYAGIGGGRLNEIWRGSSYSVIGGGASQSIEDSDRSTIAGGDNNSIRSNSSIATVSGGRDNTIEHNSGGAVVAGGFGNRIINGSGFAVVGGGRNNHLGGNAGDSVIAGGAGNIIRTNAAMSVISGGSSNRIEFTAEHAAIGGGRLNTNYGAYATIPGGEFNVAEGDYSFAAGQRAYAVHKGSFVWADTENATFFSSRTNQFSIRASGGMRLSDSTPALSFGSTTRQMLNLYDTTYGIGVQNSALYMRSSSAFAWFQDGVHTNTQFNPGPGGTEMMRLSSAGNLDVRGNVTANSVILTSDRNAKENFTAVDPVAILQKVATLPISQWNYKTDATTRHIGPVAQDFRAAFNVGPDEKHIATVDADGVALAAIQGLNRKLESELRQRDSENRQLKERLAALEAIVARLSASSAE